MLDQLDFGILSLISKFFTTPQFKTSDGSEIPETYFNVFFLKEKCNHINSKLDCKLEAKMI